MMTITRKSSKPLKLGACAVLAAACALLSGCQSMSGLANSSAKFACKAPDGVSCTSVSGVYANARLNNLPAQQQRHGEHSELRQSAPAPPNATSETLMAAALPGMPIRSQPRTLRVWVAPWVDEEGVLHDQSYLYLMIDPGRWLVEHSREATVRTTLNRLRPFGRSGPAVENAAGDAGVPAQRLTDVAHDQAAQEAARSVARSANADEGRDAGSAREDARQEEREAQ
jgi:conjugal transfer pilus assembly protein TraV